MKLLAKYACLLGTAASLAACGGSSETSPPASLSLAPDASTVDWNTSSAIDVLGNDSGNNGMVLTGVSGATNGTAVVANGKISYTPNAGFYGVENLSYTVASFDSRVTAKSTAAVTVEALLTLNGNASDNPLANATVSATVGGKTFTATTKANGDFSLVLRSTKGTDFVVLTATGSGGQAPVKLASLVGDIAGLAKDSNAQGQVSMADAPNIAVSHITTAFLALATKSLGAAPTTPQQLQDVASKVDVDEVMRLATAIKLTADAGVPLPAGITDTLALVQSETAITAVYAAAQVLDPLLAANTRATVEDQTVSAGPDFTLGTLTERTVVYRDFTVQYRKNGTARMSGRMGERDNMTWTADGPNIKLVYQQPVVFFYGAGELKANGVPTPYGIKEVADGMIILRVLNENTIRWGETGSVTWVDGPDAGKAAAGINVTTTNQTEALSSAFNIDQRQPITAAMTAPGTVLGGAVSIPFPSIDTVNYPGTGFLDFVPQRTDALEFISATEARFVLSGRVVSYSVSDNWITIVHQNGGATWRFGLLGTSGTNGLQTWVAQDVADGLLVPFTAQISDTPKLKFTDELALHRFVDATATVRLTGQLNADHSVTSTIYPSATYTNSWEVTAAGDLVVKHVRTVDGRLIRSTRFVPIKFVGKKLWYVAALSANGSILSYMEDQN